MLRPAELGSPAQPGPPCPGGVPRRDEQTRLALSPGHNLPKQRPSAAQGRALAGQRLSQPPRAKGRVLAPFGPFEVQRGCRSWGQGGMLGWWAAAPM